MMKILYKNVNIFLLLILMIFQSNIILAHYDKSYKKLVQEGNVALNNADYQKAIKYYYKAFSSIKKFNKKHLPLLYNIGYTQMQLKEYKNASSSFSKYLRISNREVTEKTEELKQVLQWKNFCTSKLENDAFEDNMFDQGYINKIDNDIGEFEQTTNTSDGDENIYFMEKGNDELDFLAEPNQSEFDLPEEDAPIDLDEEFSIYENLINEDEFPTEPEKPVKNNKEVKNQSKKEHSTGIQIIEANIIPLSEYLARHNIKVEELKSQRNKMSTVKSFNKIESYFNLYKISVDDLFFKIQIGAFAFPITNYSLGFPKIHSKDIQEEKYRLYKYTTGEFNTLQVARQHKILLRSKGLKDAFIVCYYKGQRVSMYDALQLLKNYQQTELSLLSE